MTAYDRQSRGSPHKLEAHEPNRARCAPGVSYYNSLAFRSMKPITQSVYRNIIDRFCREKISRGIEHGDLSAAGIQRKHIIKLMAARADKPDSANGLRKVLRAMMQHAIEIDLRADDPTQGVKNIRPKSRLGFHRWTEAEIPQFEERHPIGSKPALHLRLASTPDRRGRMSWRWARSTFAKRF